MFSTNQNELNHMGNHVMVEKKILLKCDGLDLVNNVGNIVGLGYVIKKKRQLQ